MAVISRTQLVKELEPGLHALFGMEYKRWEREHAEIFTEETSTLAQFYEGDCHVWRMKNSLTIAAKRKNKAKYLYILTPKGISEKSKITLRFMKRKMKEYDELKEELKKSDR